ncbi:MAG: DMT family transporter [Acidobacteria bacterium]|nr:DMT family transporter [Acidobacteriota bacterium]
MSQLTTPGSGTRSLHGLGVLSGLAAGAWLGAAEAPTKLVTAGFSPFIISFGMVAGVFVARWTLPVLVVGTARLGDDLRRRPHLIVWAVLAGMLWVVANTLTVFAIRDVGLSIAFPLWNTNSLVGLFWGWLLFNELRGAAARDWGKVAGGALAIVLGACVLAYATSHQGAAEGQAWRGILAALGAGLLWGTMYVPYRKAYISGMNPFSFVTVFTVGELATMTVLVLAFSGGAEGLARDLSAVRPALFWLFLGGFCWVIGDLFQQYAAKYIGIGRGIPLSNTNQLWGLAWAVFVFGELAGQSGTARALVVGGSLIMIVGAVLISRAEASAAERARWDEAADRERDRYGVEMSGGGVGEARSAAGGRRWWDAAIVLAALGVFAWLALEAERQALSVSVPAALVLGVATLALLGYVAWQLWRKTGFE